MCRDLAGNIWAGTEDQGVWRFSPTAMAGSRYIHFTSKVLLVFRDPNCGPCDAVAPELVRIHEAHRGNGLSVVLVGRGDPDENRAKAGKFGFPFPVVLQKKWELSKQYGIFATPVAFLVDEAGVIAQPVGQGAAGIVALVPELETAIS